MDYKELKERQAWTLDQKVDHAMGVIDQFYNRLDGKVYVSTSGGRDSTVLLWIARKIFPNIKGVFCNTRNEYPEIVHFAKTLSNVEIIYPELKPKEVFAKHGFPIISKEVSQYINSVQNSPNSLQARRAMGLLTDEELSKNKFRGNIPKKYMNLISIFNISDKCCNELKKKPFKKYEKETGLSPILGIMADESNLRITQYIKRNGCNAFDSKRINSHPLSIFLENDIDCIINKYNIPISEIYQKGAKRTGCAFCGYGCHLDNGNRLDLVYKLHPKLYNMFLKYSNNEIEYREVLRKYLAIDGMYLPDERPKSLFDE